MADIAVNLLEGPVRLNLTEVDDTPVSAGWHGVKIITAEAKMSKDGTKPQINVMARVTDETSLQFDASRRAFVEQIGLAAVQSNKTFIMVPPGTAMLKIEEKWEAMPDEG